MLLRYNPSNREANHCGRPLVSWSSHPGQPNCLCVHGSKSCKSQPRAQELPQRVLFVLTNTPRNREDSIIRSCAVSFVSAYSCGPYASDMSAHLCASFRKDVHGGPVMSITVSFMSSISFTEVCRTMVWGINGQS